MVSFATLWPWVGLGAAGMLFLLLVAGDSLVADRRSPRWQDSAWLAFAAFALTLLHQFEESGIDLSGRPSALLSLLCTGFGFRDAVACPVPVAFLTAYNVGTVWIAGLIAILAAPRHPLFGLTVFAVPLGNLILHIGAGLGLARYNPGLASALLMLPLAVWSFLVAGARHGAGPRVFAAILAAALFTGGLSLALLLAARHGYVGDVPVSAALVLLGLVPAAFMRFAVRKSDPPKAARRAPARRPRSTAPKTAPTPPPD
ncbi:MAG: HXXEE domain-containing protein [Pseudomonadota bacterium]